MGESSEQVGRLRELPGPARDEGTSQGPDRVPGDREEEVDDDDDAGGVGAAPAAAEEEDSKDGRKDLPGHEEPEGGARMLPASSVGETAAHENRHRDHVV